jgi:alanyl-tRNA synthetase
MTRLIYLEDPTCLACDVQIMKCDPHPEGFALILDQTPFYPEGGGQPGDTGRIGDAVVINVVTSPDKEVLHIVDKALSPGSTRASVDVERRSDHTQQHAAQHLLSACLLELCEAATIGFHMSELYTSIDLDKKVDQDALERAVLMANEGIRSALPIEALYPDEATLQSLPLRKIPKVEENIRVIRIGDLDYSPCGGTHPDTTAAIGCLMITRFENYKAGTRVEFVAGERAIRDMLRKNAALTQLSQCLAIPVSDIVKGVEKLLTNQSKLEKELRQAKAALLELEAEKLVSEIERSDEHQLIKILQGKDMSDLRVLSSGALKAMPDAVVILASTGTDGSQAQLLCARGDNLPKLDIREVFKPAIALLEGRGGGNATVAQGGGPRVELLEQALEAASSALAQQRGLMEV